MAQGKMSLGGRETRKACAVKERWKLPLLQLTPALRVDESASQTSAAGQREMARTQRSRGLWVRREMMVSSPREQCNVEIAHAFGLINFILK